MGITGIAQPVSIPFTVTHIDTGAICEAFGISEPRRDVRLISGKYDPPPAKVVGYWANKENK